MCLALMAEGRSNAGDRAALVGRLGDVETHHNISPSSASAGASGTTDACSRFLL